MLLEQLEKDALEARKNKDSLKANLLKTLVAEARMVGKNAGEGGRDTTDQETLAVIKKFMKGVNESIEAKQKIGSETSELETEKEILEAYLPKQLSEQELEKIVSDMISALPEKSPKMMGKIMGELKNSYDGQYDGKMASGVVKRLLSS